MGGKGNGDSDSPYWHTWPAEHEKTKKNNQTPIPSLPLSSPLAHHGRKVGRSSKQPWEWTKAQASFSGWGQFCSRRIVTFLRANTCYSPPPKKSSSFACESIAKNHTPVAGKCPSTFFLFQVMWNNKDRRMDEKWPHTHRQNWQWRANCFSSWHQVRRLVPVKAQDNFPFPSKACYFLTYLRCCQNSTLAWYTATALLWWLLWGWKLGGKESCANHCARHRNLNYGCRKFLLSQIHWRLHVQKGNNWTKWTRSGDRLTMDNRHFCSHLDCALNSIGWTHAQRTVMVSEQFPGMKENIQPMELHRRLNTLTAACLTTNMRISTCGKCD